MCWKKTNVQCEKIKFIGDWLKEEFSFSDLCKRYQISRKTGYKLINRYEAEGEKAFEERSHARHHHPNETEILIKQKIIALKHRYPKWGPEKLWQWLKRQEPQSRWPAVSTMGDILKKEGLVKPRRYRKHVPGYSTPFMECEAPNVVWSADFKGHFRLRKAGAYCYPLTVSDNYSRFLLACEGFEKPTLEATQRSFKRIFREYGLPYAIRTDNGQPFASVGIGGLTRLSIWWLKLGIIPERIKAGCPEQNGRHERMHRTLKESTALPPKENFKLQQKSFDAFRQEYNCERSHQGLNGKRPADVYRSSLRQFPSKEPEVSYPDNFGIRKVRTNGHIKLFGKKYYVSELLIGEPVGVELIEDGEAILYFSQLKLGLINARENKIIRL
jgi:putative transposase